MTVVALGSGRKCRRGNGVDSYCIYTPNPKLKLWSGSWPTMEVTFAQQPMQHSADGNVSNAVLVDLNRREESSTGGQLAVYLPCAMLTQQGTVVLAQCEARLPSLKTLEKVMDSAMDGCLIFCGQRFKNTPTCFSWLERDKRQ